MSNLKDHPLWLGICLLNPAANTHQALKPQTGLCWSRQIVCPDISYCFVIPWTILSERVWELKLTVVDVEASSANIWYFI